MDHEQCQCSTGWITLSTNCMKQRFQGVTSKLANDKYQCRDHISQGVNAATLTTETGHMM